MSVREVIALQEFARWAIREGAFQAADLDGLSIQEKAHGLGMIEATTYDPERHGPSDCAERGDEWFTFAPFLTAAGYVILSPDEVRALDRIAQGDLPGVWQEKFEAAQAIIRSLKGGRDAQ